MSIVGLPPLSGFTAKVMMLMTVQSHSAAPWLWALMLAGGLISLIVLGRAGTIIFWKTLPENPLHTSRAISFVHAFPALTLLSISPLLVLLGGPISEFAYATADQITRPAQYVEAVLGLDNAVLLLQSKGG